jgi:hypothetical protein
VVFDYLYDVYLFEIPHVCKLNWTKWPSEVLSFSVPNVNVQDLQTTLDALMRVRFE